MADSRQDVSPARLELPCGETVALSRFDMGMRSFSCSCGDDHAIVMDVHPLSRFVPESTVSILQEVVEPAGEFESFETIHLMGLVLEEFPDAVVSQDVSEQGQFGYSLIFVTDFDDRRLHEIVVELLVELMDHAISHSEDATARTDFQRYLDDFDVTAFVERYRDEREFETEHDAPL